MAYVEACLRLLPSAPVEKVLPVLLALFQFSQRGDGAVVLHAIEHVVLTVINV